MAQSETVKTQSSGGLGVLGVLTIIFIVLKLTGNIDWSWLWVLSPIWLPFAVILSAGVLIFLFVLIYVGINRIFNSGSSSR